MPKVARRTTTSLEIKLYDRDLSSSNLVENLTEKVQNLNFSTRLPGGFNLCKFRLKADLPEAWDWLTRRMFYRIVITDNQRTLWEGRLEDLGLEAGHADVVAYGYYANLRDVPFRTTKNQIWTTTVKDFLTAVCLQINSDQSNIDDTNITVDLAADSSYLDIYPQILLNKLLPFGDSSNNQWDFAIWEDRIPYLNARSITSVDWLTSLKDLSRFRLTHRGGDIWNSAYAVYDAAGIQRTADADDSDSQTKFNLTRQFVIPDLGTVAAGAAQASRDVWLEEHKDVRPRLENIVLGNQVSDSNGTPFPSFWIRAGEVVRIRDLVPASGDLDAVTRDSQRTYFIKETIYDVDKGTLRIVPDTQITRLGAL
ncbi:hypothetical protein LCGC14_2631000, partial [marine sediment metagenome]